MPDPRYDALIQRLLKAYNLGDLLPGLHEDAIVALIQHKVDEYDKNIEAAQLAAERYREMAEGEHCERLKAEAERDRLIEGCIAETWRKPCRTMANAWDDDIQEDHGYSWKFGVSGGFVDRRDQAIAAVRKAAGLEAS